MSVYRHRVDFQSDSSPDGVDDPTYATFLWDIPCEIVPVGGGEKYRGKQLQAETSYVIETRHYEGLLPNQIAINSVTNAQYLIKRILDKDGRGRHLMIEAVEVVV